MRAISIWQPWATLLASGAKRIETRSWYPRGLRSDQLVAIHAGKRWTTQVRDLCQADPMFRRYLQLAERRGLWSFEHPPLGCIVAIARFERAMPTEELASQITQRERRFGNYGPGRFGWIFSDVQPIRPVPLRGQQGLFEWATQADDVAGLELPS